jgi:hypothetical protein
VDVEMLPQTQRDHKWTGGVCYGYREPGGKWRWNFARTPFSFDAATQKFRAHIPVERGPIDAMKLVFDYTVPQQFVSSVSVTTRNIGRTPDPIPPRPR